MRARWTPAVASALAGVCCGALLLLGGVSPALATDAGGLSSVVNGRRPDKTSGSNNDYLQIKAPAACDAAATKHVTRITTVRARRASDQRAAAAWVGENLYATSAVGMPGPLTVEGSISWQGLADARGRKIVPGRYDFVLRCQDNLGTKIYQEWHGGVTFSSPTAWTGFTGSGVGASGTRSGSPSTPASADSTATPSGTAATAGALAPTPDATSGAVTSSTATSSAATSSAVPSPSSSDGAAVGAAKNGGRGGGLATTGAAVVGAALLGLVLILAGRALILLSRRRRPSGPTRMSPR